MLLLFAIVLFYTFCFQDFKGKDIWYTKSMCNVNKYIVLLIYFLATTKVIAVIIAFIPKLRGKSFQEIIAIINVKMISTLLSSLIVLSYAWLILQFSADNCNKLNANYDTKKELQFSLFSFLIPPIRQFPAIIHSLWMVSNQEISQFNLNTLRAPAIFSSSSSSH
ncbi:hypothetical protein MXB_3881 [Myxobolus squamalis]|nr:hypothetical protein MXB_3881 [Myxobolus squamalis]